MVTDPTFTNVTLAWTVLDVPTANDRRVTVEGLTKATTCHWRVRATNAAGTGSWSEDRFTTIDRAPRRYYIKDHLGSIRAVVDPDAPGTGAQKVVETRDYYPFGLRMPGRSVTEGIPAEEDYTGHELDGETGMHYAGARYYMSALGRWNGPDPILREQSPAKLLKDGKVQAFSMSAYTYSFNNPANLRDETGKWPTPDTFLDIGFIAYDVYDIASTALSGEEVSGTQWAALAADGGSLLIPAATGGGMAVRAAAKGDEVVQGSKAYWKAIRQAGRKGEEITQSVYGFSKKEAEVLVPSPSGTTKSGTRRVDFMNAEHGMVESKNVAELSFTQQLRDFADVAEELNVDFTIVTRKDTKITGPLQDAIDEGRIKLNRQIE